jgi:hypothetical protein
MHYLNHPHVGNGGDVLERVLLDRIRHQDYDCGLPANVVTISAATRARINVPRERRTGS